MKLYIIFLICGVLTSLIFPPFFLTPLGFIVFPCLLYLINLDDYKYQKTRQHFISGFIYGLGFFTIYLGWIKEPFLFDDFTRNYSFFSYLLIIYCSLFFAFIFLILKFFKSLIFKYFMLPALIVCGEFICANFSYGFPWFSFSLTNSGNFFGTKLIFYIGTYGLSYISILIFLFPYIFIIRNPKLKKNFILFYFILLFILLFLLIDRMITKHNTIKNNEHTISLVQMNFPINQSLDKEQLKIRYDRIINIIANNNSDFIIFAENNYPYLMNDFDIKLLQDKLNHNTSLIIGSTTKQNSNYFNSFFLINKKGFKKFDKKILVPFGEFIPLRSIFSFMQFIAGSSDYSVGVHKRIINVNESINILPVICYEIIYFWRLLNNQNIFSNIIVNLTNDSWFGNFSGPYQHFYFSKLRAAEFNKPLIRVSNNGVSAAIDNFGNIIEKIKLNKTNIKTFKFELTLNQNNHIKIHKLIFLLIFLSPFLSIILIKKLNYES